MKQLNVPAEIERQLCELLHPARSLESYHVIKSGVYSLIEQVGKELVPPPKATKGANDAVNSYEVGWNDCRAAQRQALNALLKGEKDA